MNKLTEVQEARVIIAGLVTIIAIMLFIIFKQRHEVNDLTNENIQLRQRLLEVNDELSALEHELNSAQNMIGDWATFEYNEYLEELCLKFGYTHTIHAMNPIEGDSVLMKKITIHGDW